MPGEPWLFVSKPLRAPFSDGSNVLVRDLVANLPAGRRLSYFGDPTTPVREAAGDEIIAAASMGHAPGMRDKLGVLLAIVRPARRRQPLHFFFTPNRVTSSVVAGLRALQPHRPMIQTLMSSERAEEHARFLGALDAIVVLSDHTARKLEAAGISAERVHRIHPGVEPVADVDAEEVADRRRVLYAGDLGPHVATRLIALGRALDDPALVDWSLTIAARPKADDDATHRAAISRELEPAIQAGRVELLGEVPDMDALMRRCSIQVFAADHVRRKVDLPLAVLEGLARGLGLVALDFEPLAEIFARAESLGLEPGRCVDADASGAALVEAVREAAASRELLLRWPRDARRLVERAFCVEHMARAYAELYDRLEARS